MSERVENPDLTVVIVSYNTAHLLDRMFEAIFAARRELKLQIIVVDNASWDNSREIIRLKYPDVKLIENEKNAGFGRANNKAVAEALGRYIVLLNTDAFVAPDTFEKTTKYMDAHPECGVLGVKILGPDGSLRPCGRFFPTPWNVFLINTGLYRLFPHVQLVDNNLCDQSSVSDCDWVTGCYYMVRRTVIDHIGLFDPRFFLYYEEVDHCREVRRAGWKVRYYPFTSVEHIGGASAISDQNQSLNSSRQIEPALIESELLYFRKHFGLYGVILAVALSAIVYIYNIVKAVLRADRTRLSVMIRRSLMTFRLLIQTRFASTPTR